MFVWGLVSLALFHYIATGMSAFTVTTSNSQVKVKQNEAADLMCEYSADFRPARVEWKFKDVKGSQKYVFFDGKITEPYSGRATIMSGANLRLEKTTVKDNGVYDCEVSGNGQFGETRVTLLVKVPPGVPRCAVPTSVTTGKEAILTCNDNVGSPPPNYKWFKEGILLPADPKTVPAFNNLTYSLDQKSGKLVFKAASKMDTGSYYCVADNGEAPSQKCRATRMEVRDLNTGGIVAGVIIFLLLLALLGFGIWYAYKKGYIPKKSDKPKSNVVYQPPSVYGGGEEDDGDFKQKSSFVV